MADRKAERAKAAERTRDAERTKEAILVAAEDRFARLGFDGTSLQQIGEAAGVARSTPAYFFGSKKALYDAVLARVIARAQEAMARAYADEDGDRSAEEAAEIVRQRLPRLPRPRSELRPPHPARGARRRKPRRRVLRPLRRRGCRRTQARSREGGHLTRAPRPRPRGALLVSVRERAHAHARARDEGPRPRLPRRTETAPRRSGASDDTFQVMTGTSTKWTPGSAGLRIPCDHQLRKLVACSRVAVPERQRRSGANDKSLGPGLSFDSIRAVT